MYVLTCSLEDPGASDPEEPRDDPSAFQESYDDINVDHLLNNFQLVIILILYFTSGQWIHVVILVVYIITQQSRLEIFHWLIQILFFCLLPVFLHLFPFVLPPDLTFFSSFIHHLLFSPSLPPSLSTSPFPSSPSCLLLFSLFSLFEEKPVLEKVPRLRHQTVHLKTTTTTTTLHYPKDKVTWSTSNDGNDDDDVYSVLLCCVLDTYIHSTNLKWTVPPKDLNTVCVHVGRSQFGADVRLQRRSEVKSQLRVSFSLKFTVNFSNVWSWSQTFHQTTRALTVEFNECWCCVIFYFFTIWVQRCVRGRWHFFDMMHYRFLLNK